MKKESVQEIQDESFRNMSVAEKLRIASGMFKRARELNPEYFSHVQERFLLEKLKEAQPLFRSIQHMTQNIKNLDWDYLKKWAVAQDAWGTLQKLKKSVY